VIDALNSKFQQTRENVKKTNAKTKRLCFLMDLVNHVSGIKHLTNRNESVRRFNVKTIKF